VLNLIPSIDRSVDNVEFNVVLDIMCNVVDILWLYVPSELYLLSSWPSTHRDVCL